MMYRTETTSLYAWTTIDVGPPPGRSDANILCTRPSVSDNNDTAWLPAARSECPDDDRIKIMPGYVLYTWAMALYPSGAETRPSAEPYALNSFTAGQGAGARGGRQGTSSTTNPWALRSVAGRQRST